PEQTRKILIGPSLNVDPLGRTVVDLGTNEGLEVVELDLNLVRETREKLPLLQNRRTDVYARNPNAKVPLPMAGAPKLNRRRKKFRRQGDSATLQRIRAFHICPSTGF